MRRKWRGLQVPERKEADLVSTKSLVAGRPQNPNTLRPVRMLIVSGKNRNERVVVSRRWSGTKPRRESGASIFEGLVAGILKVGQFMTP